MDSGIGLPWKAMDVLARGDNRSLPPNEGDVWRMDFSRFNQYKEALPRAIRAAGRGVHMAFGTHTCPSVFPLSNFLTPPCSTDRIPLRSVQETRLAMTTEIVQLRADDFEDAMDFMNLVFSASSPTDFPPAITCTISAR